MKKKHVTITEVVKYDVLVEVEDDADDETIEEAALDILVTNGEEDERVTLLEVSEREAEVDDHSDIYDEEDEEDA